ncbi:transcriptional regulator [Allostella humosa]|uniref:helix-turn-helix domain-containing protein n=1 Tax=Stella humosa TaxID=94 RepID=UPI00113C3C85|nr:transcriptional regulator [Stella humosa]BBK30876.1 transcriptional regulator [Stella humosa]
MDIRPIRNDDDHAAAVLEISRLVVADPAPGSTDDDRLAVLGTLVDAYESHRWPTMTLEPITMLRHVMEDQGRSQADLGRVLGLRSRASEVLGRRRRLTTGMIYALHKAWGIPVEALIMPYDLAPAAKKVGPATRTSGRRRKSAKPPRQPAVGIAGSD